MLKTFTLSKSGLSQEEYRSLEKLNTPAKIQDFLNALQFDFAPGDEVDRSVRGTLSKGSTDCAGGAIFAAAALFLQGRQPLLMDLQTAKPDFDHVVALFKEGKCWGAISKTNHAVLRYREPVYATPRELALSYFHEYFLPNGKKTLRGFSKPFNLAKYGFGWLTDPEAVIDIVYDLDCSPHEEIVSASAARKLRLADPIEIKAGEIVEKEL